MIYIKENKIQIKQYKQVVELHETKIEVIIGDKKVCLTGEGLHIIYYTRDELIVVGDFKHITFLCD